MLDDDAAADADLIVDTARTIEARLDPDVVRLLRHVTWRDTELGTFEEEDVKHLGRLTI